MGAQLPDYVIATGIPELFFLCLAPRWVGELLPLSSFDIFTTTTLLWLGYVLAIFLNMWEISDCVGDFYVLLATNFDS